MPRISSFYGIVVWMYWNDHNPPHFHATYGDYEVLINISDLSIYAGYLPARAYGLLMEWTMLHKEKLLETWELVQQSLPFKKIEGLQ